jgi:alcohol dehydrogenase class IV
MGLTRFEFATATRIVFGAGTLGEVAPAAAALGRRVLLVTGRAPERAAPLRAQLAARGLAVEDFAVAGEPTIATVEAGLARARAFGCDVVVGCGGGSALDAGKAIAALLANPGEALDYLEVIGRGQALAHASLPTIAVPTTAGTGAEVTRNAVLASPEQRVKVSLRSPLMLPRLAVVDPDTLTQLVEPFTSNAANPLTDALCREGLERVGRSLRRAYAGGDAAARADMALAALLGGLALANARLGAVHGLAGPLGGLFPAPHGALCARLLPGVLAANLRALRERAPDAPVIARYAEAAQRLTGDPHATADDGVAWARATVEALGVPRLGTYGLRAEDFPLVVAQAQKANSMKGNPLPLTDAEVAAVLAEAA